MNQDQQTEATNVYTACGVVGNETRQSARAGLVQQKAELDRTGDGTTDVTDDACGDLPYVTMVKNLVGVVPNAKWHLHSQLRHSSNNVGGATTAGSRRIRHSLTTM